MKSGTSYFNGPLFRRTVIRFWPIWFVYAFALALAVPVNLSGSLSGLERASQAIDAVRMAQYVPISAVCDFGMAATPIVSCAAAMAVYSHLYFPRSAAAYGALPIRREGIFCSVTAAGLLPILALNLIAALACLAVGAAYFDAVLPAAATFFAAMSLMTLAYFGIAALCAQLTGSIIALPIIFIVVNIAASVLADVVLNVLGRFIYGFVSRSSGMDIFSPFIGISRGVTYKSVMETQANGHSYVIGHYLTGWGRLICYAVFGTLLLIPSAVLYKLRRLETSGDVIAIGVLRPVFRFACSLAAGLLLAELLTELLVPDIARMGLGGAAVFALFMLLGCFIGWVAAEMLVQKSFRVFKMGRSWALLGALWVLLSALLLCCELDVSGFETRVPRADEVRSVSIDTYGGSGTMQLRESENIDLAIELHQRLVDEKALYDAADYSLDPTEPLTVNFTYQLKDGSRLTRSYRASVAVSRDDIELLETIANTTEGLLSRKLPQIEPTDSTLEYAVVNWAVPDGDGTAVKSIELTPEEALELYNECILPDMRDGTIGIVWFEADDEYRDSVYDCCISMELRSPGRLQEDYEQYETFYTYATVWSERTNAWLEAHGVEPSTLSELGNEYLYS